MATASLGTSNVRLPRPSFTYTKTLSNLPPSATTVSAMFMPLHAGSWLMSIFAALGAVPSKLTVPLTLAAVAGSIGIAAGAGAAAVLGAADCSSGFLLHAVRTRPTTAHRPSVTNHCFRFFISYTFPDYGMRALSYLTARRPSPPAGQALQLEKFCSCWFGDPWLRPPGAALPE